MCDLGSTREMTGFPMRDLYVRGVLTDRQARLKHGHIHHGAMTPEEMSAKLLQYGFREAHAEIRGELKMWDDAPAVPCLVFWAKK